MSRNDNHQLPKELAAFLDSDPVIGLDASVVSDRPTSTSTHAPQLAPKKHHWIRNGILFLIVFLMLGVIGFGVYAYSLTKNQIVDKEHQTSFIGQVHRIIDQDVEHLKGEDEDRINILLLGQGGKNHEGGTLADTIMVASIKPSTKQVALISIPRDLQVAFYLNGSKVPAYYKINSSTSRGGVDLGIEKVEEVTGLEIHYYVQIDFSGFRDVINTLGGIDVTVDNAFTDREYPDYNYGYQTISFQVGAQHMDGEKALQFARSRHGNRGEGSDFARARRQQKILEATREKALSASTLLNPAKITGLMNDLGEHVATNIEIWEMTRFAVLVQEVDTSTIMNAVIDTGPSGLLVMDGQWMVPRAGLDTYDDIQKMVKDIFETTQLAEEEEVVEPSVLVNLQKNAVSEKAKIVIENGSSVNGLASKTADSLSTLGFIVEQVGNAEVKNIKETVVYDLTDGKDPATAEYLASTLHATVIKATYPSPESTVRLGSDLDPEIIRMSLVSSKTDFVILVGTALAK